ncbi:esterase/lipase family protein [Psychrobacter sp. FDAARGOS_221]|uniref:esterase/lipase family protein n=1 Tax=Psychrobacter sp. FDAARGOS_221 TaxID=1975705 RepID=UPI000BB53A6E|nr:alpha/beta hydrolase [Psychrobacter sp. FDAARGOS_221]PNK60069.1 alpha/beta hydrolase [Psychrobacter sp. FDAARGOS_221]
MSQPAALKPSYLSVADSPATARVNLPLVVLIHGLHQRGFIMSVLGKRLKAQGFDTHLHDYHSLSAPIEEHSRSLNLWLEANYNPSDMLYLVGHSLGGLVIRDFIERYPHWSIGRCVTLGTPHNGSISAEYVSRLLPVAVGAAYQGALDGDIAPLPDRISLGVIAGNKPHGLGQLFLNHYKRKAKLSAEQSAHDGTVFVSETRLVNARDHLVLPVSHTGMLVNKTVADQTSYFLLHGHFKR